MCAAIIFDASAKGKHFLHWRSSSLLPADALVAHVGLRLGSSEVRASRRGRRTPMPTSEALESSRDDVAAVAALAPNYEWLRALKKRGTNE
jgi:hypothetical protein